MWVRRCQNPLTRVPGGSQDRLTPGPGLRVLRRDLVLAGPAPFHFITVPDHQCQDIKAISSFVSYGWGMIPAKVGIGRTEWKTALWPKDGR
jgi:hypothetical protein